MTQILVFAKFGVVAGRPGAPGGLGRGGGRKGLGRPGWCSCGGRAAWMGIRKALTTALAPRAGG